MKGLTLRPGPGRHRYTPEAWQHLSDDLDGVDQDNRLLREELAEARDELAAVREELAAQMVLRQHSDALFGPLVAQRDEAARRARYAEDCLASALQSDPEHDVDDAPADPGGEPEVDQDCTDTVPMPIPIPDIVRLGSSAWATQRQIADLGALHAS